MNKTWEPLIWGNERLIYDAMASMNNKGGSIVAITNFHHKFKRSKVEVAIQGLETNGLVKYDNTLQEYTLV